MRMILNVVLEQQAREKGFTEEIDEHKKRFGRKQ